MPIYRTKPSYVMTRKKVMHPVPETLTKQETLIAIQNAKQKKLCYQIVKVQEKGKDLQELLYIEAEGVNLRDLDSLHLADIYQYLDRIEQYVRFGQTQLGAQWAEKLSIEQKKTALEYFEHKSAAWQILLNSIR